MVSLSLGSSHPSDTRPGDNSRHGTSNDPAEQPTFFARTVFDPALSWHRAGTYPLIPGMVTLELRGPHDASLIWGAQSGTRPHMEEPATVRLLVPPSEMARGSTADFKATLLTNILSSDALSAGEPLRSTFFQSLVGRGYRIVSLDNASITDAALTLSLANRADLSRLKINVETELVAEELNLTDVEIARCKITFRVSRGEWKNVHASGNTTQLLGALGTTVIGQGCLFEECYFAGEWQRVNFGPTPSTVLKSMVFAHGSAPPEVAKLLSPMDPEEARKMYERFAAARWGSVGKGVWSATHDRASGDDLGANPFGCVRTQQP